MKKIKFKALKQKSPARILNIYNNKHSKHYFYNKKLKIRKYNLNNMKNSKLFFKKTIKS